MLSRRQLVASTAALALPACTPARPRALGAAPRCLPPVIVSPDRIIRQVVGLRPYRPSGFVVRAEALGAKRLVHNYGHGGAGITLSWGSSRLAVDLGLPGHSGAVAVIGAGVMGLTTARLVQEAGFPVTIYAAALPPETTSNIAGGQWHPAYLFSTHQPLDPGFADQLTRAADYAYRRYQILAGEEYGVRWMRNYVVSDSPLRPEAVDALIPGMRPEARELTRREHPFPFAYARQWDSPMIEPPRLLRALMRDFQIAGGRFVLGKMESPAQIAALPEGLVFNCTGLGARDLFGDTELTAVRGQLVIQLPQPEVDYALLAPGATYMFSRSDGVILGGTADRDNFSIEVDPAVTAAILERQRRAFQFRCTA